MKDERAGIAPYDLPDAVLLQPSPDAVRSLVWQPERLMVVIGKGSDPRLEVNLEAVENDGVPVVRRATGGCAVVLSPEMLVISFAVHHPKQLASKEYFRFFNTLIMEALTRQGITGLEHRGTSDIAIRGRKIAGTAIYRNRDLVFFHAILNVAGRTAAMEKYLSTPPRMPDYRHGRSHAEFVTSLAEQHFELDEERFAKDVEMLLEFTQKALFPPPAVEVQA